ncbi:MAG: helix-turn-helix transcriptional regulator [Lachnospiraceae bacterium]|nr:helix-turn-helix transcriptional regulator [Lachnospiraceae bacterium]
MEQGLLGNTIRQARIDNHMTQEQLAELVQITPTHLKHIESEHRKPSIEVLFALASVLHFSLDALLLTNETYEHTKRKNELNLLINSCTDDELDVFIAALRELTRQKRITCTE